MRGWRDETWKEMDKRRFGIATSVIALAVTALALEQSLFPNMVIVSTLVEALALAAIVGAGVDFYYNARLTEKHFERRFSKALVEATTLNEAFLSRFDECELTASLERIMEILSGKAEGHPDNGLYELIRREIIPVLGKPYRMDFEVKVNPSIVEREGRKYLQLNSVTTYVLVNPTDRAVIEDIGFWASYSRLPGFDSQELYQIRHFKVGVHEKEFNIECTESAQKVDFRGVIPVALSGQDNKEILFEEVAILEMGDMETFHPTHATKGLKLEISRVSPREEVEVEFFGFDEVAPPERILSDHRRVWTYDNWMLPQQGYAMHLPVEEGVLPE